MNGVRKALTSLSFVEERFRRAFGLVGEVGTTWSPSLIPVGIAMDFTAPGLNQHRGRRWAVVVDCSAAVGQRCLIRAIQPVVVTTIMSSISAATADHIVEVMSPAQADPIAINLLNAFWLENVADAAERAPVLSSATANDASNGVAVSWMRTAANGNCIHTAPIHLLAGAKLNLRMPGPVAAFTGKWTVAGYVF